MPLLIYIYNFIILFQKNHNFKVLNSITYNLRELFINIEVTFNIKYNSKQSVSKMLYCFFFMEQIL